MKKILTLTLCLALLLGLFSGCGGKQYDPLAGVETTVFTDDAGRDVTVPADITRIAASGSTAQMILMTLVPELLVGLASSPSTAQRPYFPAEMWTLPTFGQFYGSKANLNMEALIDAEPQLIVDLGDAKENVRSDMDGIQKQTGIPTVFLEATLEEMPQAYRKLGALLHREAEAEVLAVYLEQTLAMAAENSAKLPQDARKTVLFGTGATGLACNAEGSVQADVLSLVGAGNAIHSEEISNRNGGTTVNLEEVYACDPDVILLAAGGPYDTLAESEWSGLTAVKNGTYYEIPNLPYDWMSSPPSINRVLGIYWLGNLLYPELYDYDMVEKAQEFYRLFWQSMLHMITRSLILSYLVALENIARIHPVLHIIKRLVVAVRHDDAAYCLELRQVVDHPAAGKRFTIRQCRLVNHDGCAFRLQALHHALYAALAEVVAAALHRQAIDANNGMIFRRQRHHAVGNKVLAGLVALDNGGNHVLRHIGVVRQQLLGVFRQAVSTVAKGRIVIMSTNTRIQANTVDDLLSVQPLHLSIGIQFVEVADTQCQIGVGEQLNCLCLSKAHKQSVNVLFNCAFLQKFCKSVCRLHQTSIVHIGADNDTARIQVVI